MKNTVWMICIMLFSNVSVAEGIWEESEVQEDNINAKVLRHLAKQRAVEGSMSAKERAHMRETESKGCGSLNVGNVSGSSRNVENVVVIKGDVINANNKCK